MSRRPTREQQYQALCRCLGQYFRARRVRRIVDAVFAGLCLAMAAAGVWAVLCK